MNVSDKNSKLTTQQSVPKPPTEVPSETRLFKKTVKTETATKQKPEKKGFFHWVRTKVGHAAANAAMNPDPVVANQNTKRLIETFGNDNAKKLKILIHALAPKIASRLHTKLYDQGMELSDEERFPEFIEFILNNVIANIAEEAQTSLAKETISILDLVTYVINVVKKDKNFENLMNEISKLESSKEYIKLQKELSKYKSDSHEYKNLSNNDLIKKRNGLVKQIFDPIINLAFPRGAEDLQLKASGWLSSKFTGIATRKVWGILQDPETFVGLYDLLTINQNSSSQNPILDNVSQLLASDLTTLGRSKLIQEPSPEARTAAKEEEVKSSKALSIEEEEKKHSEELLSTEEEEKQSEELSIEVDEKLGGELSTSSKEVPSTKTTTLADKIAQSGANFLINTNQPQENPNDKSVVKKQKKEERDLNLIRSQEIQSLLSSLIQDAAASKDPTISDVWKFMFTTLGTGLRFFFENFAKAKIVGQTEQEEKETSESPTDIVKKAFSNINTIFMDFFKTHGSEMLKNYKAILHANSKQRKEWIDRIFTPLTKTLIDKILIPNESASETTKMEMAKFRKDLEESAPEKLFLVFAEYLENNPELIGWLVPDESSKALRSELDKTANGKIAIAIADSTTDKIMEQIDANKPELAEQVITKFFPSFQNEAALPAFSLRRLIINALTYAKENPDARKFIKSNVSDILLNILISSQPDGQSDGVEWSLSKLINNCWEDIQKHFNENSNLLDNPSSKEEKIKDFFIPLAEKLIKRLKLDQQAKLKAFGLNDEIRTMIANQLYDLYVMLDKAKVNMIQSQVSSLLHLSKEREDLEDQLLLLQLDEEDAVTEEEKAALLAKQEKLKNALKYLSESEAALQEDVGHLHLQDLSSGIIAPLARNKAEQAIASKDKIGQEVVESLKLNLDPVSMKWLQDELQQVIATETPGTLALWDYTQHLVAAAVPKIVLNILKSIEIAELGALLESPTVSTPPKPQPEQPAKPELPSQNILEKMIHHISTVAYENFKGDPQEFIQRDRKMRQEMADFELRNRNLAAQIERAKLEGVNKETIAGMEQAQERLHNDIELVKKHLVQNHQELVNQFMPLAIMIFQDMGPDVNDENHPLHSLPFPLSLKMQLWDEIGPKAVAEILATNIYKEIYRENPEQLREGLREIYEDSNVVAELCRVLGVMTRDIVPHQLADQSTTGKALYVVMLGIMQKAPDNAAKDSFMAYITAHRQSLEEWLESNVQTLGRNQAQFEGVPDTRTVAMRAVWDEIGKITETTLLKFMLKFSTSLKDIEKGSPEFLMEFVPSVLPAVADHIENVNLAVKNSGKSHLHEVGPERIKIEFGKMGKLHKALRPVVLSDDPVLDRLTPELKKQRFYVLDNARIARYIAKSQMPTITAEKLKTVRVSSDPRLRGLNEKEKQQFIIIPQEEVDQFLADPVKVEKLKADKAAEQKMKQFYKPLTEKLLELAQVTGEDLPFGDMTLGMIKELAPKIVASIWEKIGNDEKTIFSILNALNESASPSLSAAFANVDDVFAYDQEKPEAADESAKLAKDTPIWEKLLLNMSRALPLVLRAAADLQIGGKSVLNAPAEVLSTITNKFLSKLSITEFLDDKVFKSTLEGIHSGHYDPKTKQFQPKKLVGRVNGVDLLEQSPVSFLPPKDKSLDVRLSAERTQTLKKESMINAAKLINDGIFGFLKKMRNQKIYQPIGRLIDRIISNVKVQKGLKLLVKAIANLLMLPLFVLCIIPCVILYLIQQAIVKSQLNHWVKNIQHPINENVAMQMSLSTLDALIRRHRMLKI